MLFFDFSFATRTITDDISDHYFRQKAIKMSYCSLCTFSACRLFPCPADDCDQQFCCQDHLERFFPLLTSYKDGHISCFLATPCLSYILCRHRGRSDTCPSYIVHSDPVAGRWSTNGFSFHFGFYQ